MKKALSLLMILLVLSSLMVGCAKDAEAVVEENPNPMQYVQIETIKDQLQAGTDEYIVLDVRKAEDYATSHIANAINADQHAANKEGDDATGIEHLKAALNEATGNELGTDNSKYVLVCYSGKSYAQKGTDLLIEMGVSKDSIYTLEGGMKAWDAAGEEYTSLLEK